MLKKLMLGIYLPMTTRQTVKGVDNTSPGSPQISVQNTAATKMASGESPTWAPYSGGSTKFATANSNARKSPAVSSEWCHPGKTANDSTIGINAAIGGPT